MRTHFTKTILVTLTALIVTDFTVSFKAEKNSPKSEPLLTKKEAQEHFGSSPEPIHVNASQIRKSLIISENGTPEHEFSIKILPEKINATSYHRVNRPSKNQYIRAKF